MDAGQGGRFLRFAPLSFAVMLPLFAACGVTSNASNQGGNVSASTAPLLPTPTPTMTVAAYQQQYLTIVAPYNAAFDVFHAHLKPYIGTTNYPSENNLGSWCSPYATALTAFDNVLLRSPWPASAEADVHALVNGDAPELGDLDACGAPNEVTWFSQLSKDSDAASTAANVLRSDLGLPPPPANSP